MPTPSILLTALHIGYTSRGKPAPVFPPLWAQAEAGELVALVGRNGQGKSTLLRTVIGLQPPLGGQVHLQGKALHEYPLRTLATLVSYVSPDPVRVGNLKVYDLVALGRHPYTGWLGALSAADRREVVRALAQVGMHRHAWRTTNHLSDGERQRVMIARALAQRTPIMVLDEPTAFLDLPNRYEVALLLKQLAAEQGKTVLFSTHDLGVALKLADRIWLMHNGALHSGTPRALTDQGVFDSMLANTPLHLDRATGEVMVKPFLLTSQLKTMRV